MIEAFAIYYKQYDACYFCALNVLQVWWDIKGKLNDMEIEVSQQIKFMDTLIKQTQLFYASKLRDLITNSTSDEYLQIVETTLSFEQMLQSNIICFFTDNINDIRKATIDVMLDIHKKRFFDHNLGMHLVFGRISNHGKFYDVYPVYVLFVDVLYRELYMWVFVQFVRRADAFMLCILSRYNW